MKQIEELIEVSRRYGSDSRYVIAGGGNTSFKDDKYLWVKASGHSLGSIDEDGFALMDRTLLGQIGQKEYSGDSAEREAQVKADLSAANLTKGRRPSVETSLHDCMAYSFVVHMHPTLVNGLMCSVNAAELCEKLFPDALYVEYTDPGYTLFKKVSDRLSEYKNSRGKDAQVVFLQNHGVFVAADTISEIDAIYGQINTTLSSLISETIDQTPLPLSRPALDCIPQIRQVLSRDGRGFKTLSVQRNKLIDIFLENPKPVMAPFSPDGIVYCKSEYLYINSESPAETAEEMIEEFVSRRGYTPKVLLIKNLGLVTVGEGPKEAQVVSEVFQDSMKIAFLANNFGGEHPMEKPWIEFIDNWEAESYRRKVAKTVAPGRVQGKTIVVTGAAQGFGEGIARLLLRQGANIVVADLNEATGAATAVSFNEEAGEGRAIFVRTDVSSAESIREMLYQTIIHFGAVDCFVSNAGVLRAGGLDTLTPEEFEFVTKVNYNAYFYCAKEVSRIMKLQTAADPQYYADIVQVNSKSGLRGSKANFAYAGSKFGGIGLTQSFALELAPFRIKVNSICPGNFYDGPLWSDPEKGLFVQYLKAGKVPDAKTAEDVKAFYLAQVPMRKGCSPEDVCKAILYAIEQCGETGQAIPVTGGQVMLA